MIKRFFSKKGKGLPTLNLVLDQQTARSGETVTGHVVIRGAGTEDVISKLHVHLLFYAKVGSDQANSIVQTIDVATDAPFVAKGELRFPISLVLPEVPQTSQLVRYRFRTTATFAKGTAQHNSDDFTLLPSDPVRTVQNGWRTLGFKDVPRSGYFNGAVQVFEYDVIKDSLKKRISEPDAVFLPEDGGVRMHLAFRTQATAHPQYATLFLTAQQLQSREQTQQVIAAFLEKELHNPAPNNVPTLAVFKKQEGNETKPVTPSADKNHIANKSFYQLGVLAYTFVVMGAASSDTQWGNEEFVFDSIPFDPNGYGSYRGDPTAYGAAGGGGDVSHFDGGSYDGGGSFDGGSGTTI